MELNKHKAALIVIDMQVSFCKPEGRVAAIGLDTAACQAVVGPCAEVLQAARAVDMPVFFTRYVYQKDYADGGVMINHLMPELAEVNALKAGSKDADIVPELMPRAGEQVIDKNRPSAFFDTELESLLADAACKQLVVCGVTTNCCVESTVRDASHRDMQVFVIEDACAELDPERHVASLKTMDMLFADIISLDALRKALQ